MNTVSFENYYPDFEEYWMDVEEDVMTEEDEENASENKDNNIVGEDESLSQRILHYKNVKDAVDTSDKLAKEYSK